MADLDIDKLEAELAADIHAEDYCCPRCECEVSLDDGLEPTVYCHMCATSITESELPALLTRLRAAEARVLEQQAVIEAAIAWNGEAQFGEAVFAASNHLSAMVDALLAIRKGAP